VAVVQSGGVQADEHGLRWWAMWDNTTGDDVTPPPGETYTEIDWDNSAGVARVARIVMKDGSVITVPIAAGATGRHTLNKPQQTSWASIQFLLA
jgi:hypothetical protein